MALVVLTLAEMKAHSALAEVQALTNGTLEPLEAEALDLLEAELGRRLTVDTEDVARTLDGRGISLIVLPERLDQVTSVVSTSLGDVTASVETAARSVSGNHARPGGPAMTTVEMAANLASSG